MEGRATQEDRVSLVEGRHTVDRAKLWHPRLTSGIEHLLSANG